MSDRKLVPLDSVSSAPLRWLWKGRIPLGGITLLDGDPGDGKSTVMYDLAARVTVDYAAKRRILEIVCLNFRLDDVTLVPEIRKPFDILAEGPSVQLSRGDWI